MKLRVESRGQPSAVAEVTGDSFTIGREQGADLLVDDPEVSRVHAEIRRRADGTFELHDGRSRNGTLIDGRRVDRPVPLRGGERIEIGHTVIVVEPEDDRSNRTVVAGTVQSAGLPEVDRDRTVVGRPNLATSPHRRRAEEPPSRAPANPPLASPAPAARRDSPSRVQSRIERAHLRKRTNRALWIAGAALVAGVAAIGLAVAGVFDREPAPPRTVEDVVAEVAPSTVLVVARRGDERAGSGTGWVLDGRQGLIVTNAHVVNGGETFEIGAGRDMREATVVGSAPCEDLAVLRVGESRGLRTLPLGSQADLRQGRTVVAIGYPANASLQDNLTSTAGIVSVVRSSFRFEAVDVPRYPNVVQTDAAINPGNSGGPLVDLDGRLVGVNSAGFDLVGGRRIQGQGYAVGVDRVKTVVPRLRTGDSMGWTGAGLGYLDPAELRRNGLRAGLLITGAARGSAAARARLGRRPELLLAVNGRSVGTRLQTYCRAVRGIDSGESARLTLAGARGVREQRVRFE